MEELLQKHRTFTIAVAVGGFVFLIALMVRGCAVYDLDLESENKKVASKAGELNKEPVPDKAYLDKLESIVEQADRRVQNLAGAVGRTENGEKLWEACISDILAVLGKDTEAYRNEIVGIARRLPNAAFTRLLGDVQSVMAERASQANVIIGQEDYGFERITDEDFSRNLAALAAVVRVVDRSIREGVQKIERITVSGNVGRRGGTEAQPFIRMQPVGFVLKGDPPILARVVRSLNERDRGGVGRSIVLDEVSGLGRPTTVRPQDAGTVEFRFNVLLVDLEAEDEEATQ
jgi:hypothetical protein